MPADLRTAAFEERTVQSGQVRLRCVTAGPANGPLVLFLHGFPARWSTWRGILPAFARAGYLAVAPDLRGYGASDRPAGVDSYSIMRIVEDVIAILDAFGRRRSVVVGHDVGGGVAWATAMAHPERFERLAILNSVHPVGFERRMRKWSQLASDVHFASRVSNPPTPNRTISARPTGRFAAMRSSTQSKPDARSERAHPGTPTMGTSPLCPSSRRFPGSTGMPR
ncbi:MAG: alpha/beta fold hydrolase [Myxococcales bacterium]|nr:alpha/beta fold hydrolase [Myxococcales bacterium]